MATTYEACKDIINIQMETRKRKIEEKAHTKRIGEQRNGNSETVQRNRQKNVHTHSHSHWLWLTLALALTHIHNNDLYFNIVSMCAAYII